MKKFVFVSEFYKSVFGCKTYKIALDGGFTCPNRDGSKGVGGCIFCSQSGSGDFAADRALSVSEQIEQGISLVESKAKGRSGQGEHKFIAYFQNFSNTYGSVHHLEEIYFSALKNKNVSGLALATRPDCINSEILSLLKRISRDFFVQLELGLQTASEKTGILINRKYSDEDYSNAVRLAAEICPDIHVVTHVLFGLPGEKEEDMLKTVSFVCEQNKRSRNFGIKIANLYVVKNTVLNEMYERKEYVPLEKEQYFTVLKKALTLLPENTVIHRLTGDPPKKILISPSWCSSKKTVLNEIHNILKSM